MSADFTFVLACKAPAVGTLFERVEKHLRSLGFVRDREAIASREAEADPEEEVTLSVTDLAEEKTLLDDWHSIYMGFHSHQISLGVQFDLRAAGITHGYVSMNMREMYRLHKSAIPEGLYDVIGGIAGLAEAVGGYGGFEAAYKAASPEQTLAALLTNPGDHDLWFSLHIVEVSRLANTRAENSWARDFVRAERRGFVFFIRREFLELCKEFG